MKKHWIDRIILPLALVVAVVWFATAVQIPAVTTSTVRDGSVELPIIMYHHISTNPSHLNDYTITPDAFRADLKWLQSQGYTAIVVEDLINYVQNDLLLPERPVMIIFDDGYESFHEYAFPILEELNCKAVFAVIGRYVDQYSETPDHHVSYSHATWEQLLQMQEIGLVEIQNHSYNLHTSDGARRGSKKRPDETLPAYYEALSFDLDRVQQACAEQLGKTPTAFAFPFGFICPEALDVLKVMGFQAAFTCEEKINYLTGDPEELFRLRRFNRPNDTSVETILRRAGATLTPLSPK